MDGDGAMYKKSISMDGQRWAKIDAFAKDEGFTRSLALRRILDEWQALKRRELVGNGRVALVVRAYLDGKVLAEEAMEAIAASPGIVS